MSPIGALPQTLIVVALCAGFARHLPEFIAADEDCVGSRNVASDEVLRQCLEGLAGRINVAIIELNYFDVDYRSVAAIALLSKHELGPIRTDRVVLAYTDNDVTGDLTQSDVLNLVGKSEVKAYMVITPDPTGPVGRSLLPPPASLQGVKPEVDIAAHVRTVVIEHITVLGILKAVTGVPFIQQDGHTFSCAHSTTWMAHYTAVLRGICSRRAAGSFHSHASEWSAGRQFPSNGLTVAQMAGLLTTFGLPVEKYIISDLVKEGRHHDWYDRDQIRTLSKDLRELGGGDLEFADNLDNLDMGDESHQALASRAEALWFKESFTRTICQYLNSGFPCILIDLSHATSIIGYVRKKDLTDESPHISPDLSDTDVAALIVSDDQQGPVVLVGVKDIMQSFTDRPDRTALLAPLPAGVWVSGANAEIVGTQAFMRATKTFAAAPSAGPTDYVAHVSPEVVADVSAHLTAMHSHITSAETASATYSVRSYVVPGTDFKAGFADRCDDAIAVEQVQFANLPKYVWVVEVMERALRDRHESSVVGEIVLDATDMDIQEAKALIVHLPGSIQVRASVNKGPIHYTGVVDPYRSGRYHGSKDWLTKSDATLARTKHAAS